MATCLSQPSALAEERRARGISLGTIESSTRITLRFLEAIEAEDFDKLPGGVYTTSYLRQYARAIGLDETALLQRYYAKTTPSPGAEQDSAPSRLTQWLHDCQLSRIFLHWLPRQQ